MISLYKLSRLPKHRQHLLRVMLTCLVAHERIHTTRTKALALVRMAEKIIRYAKNANKGDHNSYRRLCKWLPSKQSRTKIMLQISPRFQNQFTSFTRVSSLVGRCKGDKSPIHFVEYKNNPLALYQKRTKEDEIKQGKVKDPKVYRKKLLLEQKKYYEEQISMLQKSGQKGMAIGYMKGRLMLVQHDLQNLDKKKFTRQMPFRSLAIQH